VSLLHAVTIRARDGYLTRDAVMAVTADLIGVLADEKACIRITGRLRDFEPGAGELLGRCLAHCTQEPDLNGQGPAIRDLWASIRAGAREAALANQRRNPA
jgi:hypothetical protein